MIPHAAEEARADLTSSASTTSLPMRAGDAYFASDDRPIILFDGVCNLCNGGVQFVLDFDTAGRTRFAALQSDAGRALLERAGRSPDDISSIVLVERDRSSTKAEAVLRIGALLDAPLPVLAYFFLSSPAGLFPAVYDVVYDTVAANRYTLFGRTTECRLSDPKHADRFVGA